MSVMGMFLLTFPGVLIAQDDIAQEHSFDRYPNALGFSAGNIIGPGITWMHWPNRTGFQVAGGILYFPPDSDDWSGNDTTLDYNLGTEVLHHVYGDTFSSWIAGRLFLWGSVKHRGYIPVEWENADDTDPVGDYTVGDYIPVVAGGVGIGIEVIIFDHFAIPFQFGYVAETEFPDPDSVRFSIDLAFQSGFRYRY